MAREHNRPVANEIIVWGDVLAGLHAANAVVGALGHRDRTGPGTHLDIAMAEAVLASMGRDDLLADDPVPIPRGAIRSDAFHAGARDVLGWQGQLDVVVSVVAIHVAPGARLPMRSVSSVVAEAGLGLIGDRYHGTRHRHVSVQSAASLAEAEAELGSVITHAGTRRNITVSAGVVPTRPGAIVAIGPVVLEVVRVAAPCRLLDDGIGPGARGALHRRAGSIFRILEGGTISVGDEVTGIELP